MGGHSVPKAVVSWVACIWLPGQPVIFAALIEPPKLPLTEQVSLAVMGPDKGSIHPFYRCPAFCPHTPVREGTRVPAHGLSVFESPVLRSWTDGGQCERGHASKWLTRFSRALILITFTVCQHRNGFPKSSSHSKVETRLSTYIYARSQHYQN